MTYHFEPKGQCESIYIGRGYYKLEVWGAQGGTCGEEESGKGGYSRGVLRSNKEKQKLTICVGKQGSQGNSTTILGGFNGGGNGVNIKGNYCSGGGGGSSDIFLGDKGSIRLVIAGGGGGAGSHKSLHKGGYGGGLNGEDGKCSYEEWQGKGATNSAPGNGGYFAKTNSYSECQAESGSIGKGGNGCGSAAAAPGGGGGGYYGGGGGADQCAGGGGSGFVNSTLMNKKMFSGADTFPGITGIRETGHKGDGYALITMLCFATAKRMNMNRSFCSIFILFMFS